MLNYFIIYTCFWALYPFKFFWPCSQITCNCTKVCILSLTLSPSLPLHMLLSGWSGVNFRLAAAELRAAWTVCWQVADINSALLHPQIDKQRVERWVKVKMNFVLGAHVISSLLDLFVFQMCVCVCVCAAAAAPAHVCILSVQISSLIFFL